MYCLANICYVCLEEKNKLISDINSSLSLNKDIIHILGYLSCNLAWLKTMRIILVCEECCLRLRETYQFLEKCIKNSALLQGYMNKLNTSTVSNTGYEAELTVTLNIPHEDMNEKCEIQSEDEEIYTFQCRPNIEEIGDVFVDCEESLVKGGIICKQEVDYKQDNNSTEIIEETEDAVENVEDYFVKEENTWKREEVDDTKECPTGNNSPENMDNESFAEISVSDNGQTDCVSVRTTNKNDLKTAAKKSFQCSTCSQTFSTKSTLNIHTRNHTDEKSYECAICNTRFSKKASLIIHMRVHTHEKPYNCSRCKRSFNTKSRLVRHKPVHTGEKTYECSKCKQGFIHRSNLVRHMLIHTGEKPHKCSKCKKSFAQHSNLASHMRIHSGEKPYECSKCKKCFAQHSNLARHMRTHTGEKSYGCSKCKKCFAQHSNLARHMQIHTGEKPHNCSKCKKCFIHRSNLVRHMRTHTGEKPHKCSNCKKSFAQHSHLASHMLIHTGEKPYECSFARQSNLARHMQTHTRN